MEGYRYGFNGIVKDDEVKDMGLGFDNEEAVELGELPIPGGEYRKGFSLSKYLPTDKLTNNVNLLFKIMGVTLETGGNIKDVLESTRVEVNKPVLNNKTSTKLIEYFDKYKLDSKDSVLIKIYNGDTSPYQNARRSGGFNHLGVLINNQTHQELR